jgi:hypothetical protein
MKLSRLISFFSHQISQIWTTTSRGRLWSRVLMFFNRLGLFHSHRDYCKFVNSVTAVTQSSVSVEIRQLELGPFA